MLIDKSKVLQVCEVIWPMDVLARSILILCMQTLRHKALGAQVPLLQPSFPSYVQAPAPKWKAGPEQTRDR